MTPRLYDIPRHPEIRWQWHADRLWRDPVTGASTSYLAGFRDRDRAVAYGRRNGWHA